MIPSDGIKIPKALLKLTGLWPEESGSYLERASGIFSWLISIFFPVTLVIEVLKHLDDYQALSAQLCITVPPTSYLVKLIFCRIERKRFLKLLGRLRLEHFNEYPKDCEEIVTKSIRNSELVGTTYQAICCLVILLYCVIPYFTKENLPVRFSYELGSFKNVMYVFQVFGLAYAALNNSCIDVLATGLMSMVTAQISILNKSISSFTKNKTSKSEQKKHLKACVEHHNEIIRFIENFEEVFSIIFLVQYISSGIVICNIGFQLVHTTPLSLRFANMTFFFAAMMCELAMYSWFGNEIIVQSGAIIGACYESDWTNCDIEIRKTLIIISENSKKPLFLTAGKFSILSLASFTTVVKTSYSYFALMQSLYSKTQH